MSIYEPFHTPAKNRDDTRHTYYAREEYKILSLASARPWTRRRYLDLWYKKSLYGKIDQFGNAVTSLQESSLKPLEGSPNLFAVDFVADAFEDLRNYYINLIANRQIEPTVGNLTDITAARAWENADGLYQSHLDEMKEYFIQTYLVPNNDKIVDAKDVFRMYEKFMFNHARDFPITYAGFVLSTKCPSRASGLIIDLLDDSHGNDLIKASMLGAPAFEKYASIAARYGFFVDKNAPWSLVANLGSSALKAYMRPYGLEKPTNYFREYCHLPHRLDLDKMREFIYDCYYTFFTMAPFIQETKICRTVKKRTIPRKILTIEKVDSTIPISYWFNLYMMSRYYEVNVQLHPTTIRQLQHRVSVLNRRFNSIEALDHINEYFRNLMFHITNHPITVPMELFSITPTAADPPMPPPPPPPEGSIGTAPTAAAGPPGSGVPGQYGTRVRINEEQQRIGPTHTVRNPDAASSSDPGDLFDPTY